MVKKKAVGGRRIHYRRRPYWDMIPVQMEGSDLCMVPLKVIEDEMIWVGLSIFGEPPGMIKPMRHPSRTQELQWLTS